MWLRCWCSWSPACHRVHHSLREIAVICEKDQTLGIPIETTDRKNTVWKLFEEIRNRRAATLGVEDRRRDVLDQRDASAGYLCPGAFKVHRAHTRDARSAGYRRGGATAVAALRLLADAGPPRQPTVMADLARAVA